VQQQHARKRRIACLENMQRESKSSYANVCNVTSTREEVVLLFGMNQAWNRGQKEVTIHLTDRIVVSPFAAKRLSMLLQGVVNEYEKRFGTLNIDLPGGDAKK
jgi:hypothetical protein